MIIYLVRHGQSHHNAGTAGDQPHDQFGSHLTELGRQQARMIGDKLKDIPFSAVYASTYHRAQQTAEIMASFHQLSVGIFHGLRERDFTDSPNDEDFRKAHREFNRLFDDENSMSPQEKFEFKLHPSMENSKQVISRVIKCIRRIYKKNADSTVLIVSHGNTIRTLLIYLGFAKHHEIPAGSLKNVGYVKLEFDGKQCKVLETDGVMKT